MLLIKSDKNKELKYSVNLITNCKKNYFTKISRKFHENIRKYFDNGNFWEVQKKNWELKIVIFIWPFKRDMASKKIQEVSIIFFQQNHFLI
jgi:hypothetical protein